MSESSVKVWGNYNFHIQDFFKEGVCLNLQPQL